MIGQALTRPEPRDMNSSKCKWAVELALTSSCPFPAAPVVEFDDDMASADGSWKAATGAADEVSSMTMSSSSDEEEEEEQLLTSGEGKPHESRSSSKSSRWRLQKLIRREKLLERLEILASGLLLPGKEKNADGDHDGLRLSSACSTTCGRAAGFCCCCGAPASQLRG